jgi:RNA polymerase sigma factor (sigma-70 family)
LTEKELIYNELLVLRCRQGNKKAFEELIGLWEGKLLYYIRRLVDNEEDAWQILQQVWVVVFHGITKIRETNKFPAWLYGIARNSALNHLRSKYSESSFLKEYEEYKDASISQFEDCSEVFDNAEQVHYGLSKMSLSYREILTLFFFEDLSLIEIAAVLQLPVGTVKSRLYYAKQALRKAIEDGAKNE